MIVSELIAALQDVDPTLKVMVPGVDPDDPDNESAEYEVTDVTVGFPLDHKVSLWSNGDD